MHRDDVYAVILAGGSGTRFWPKSRALRPKQLCRIGSQYKTMVELTLDRLDGFIPPERRILVTHTEQLLLTKELCGLRIGTYLAEPDRRDTANALALAALYIEAQRRAPAIMVSLHSDHVIDPIDSFQATVQVAVAGADLGKLVLIGAKPTRPETGYGYIELGDSFPENDALRNVRTFKEKPHHELAEQYLSAGNYLWNTGIFCWRTDTILAELKARLPESLASLAAIVAKGGSALQDCSEREFAACYASLPRISIDHAVLEVSQNVLAIPATFAWRDLGSWLALAEYLPRNAQGNNFDSKNALLLDCRNALIDNSTSQFIAAIGLQDIAIVLTDDALLVCAAAHSQAVKKVVESLAESGKEHLT